MGFNDGGTENFTAQQDDGDGGGHLHKLRADAQVPGKSGKGPKNPYGIKLGSENDFVQTEEDKLRHMLHLPEAAKKPDGTMDASTRASSSDTYHKLADHIKDGWLSANRHHDSYGQQEIMKYLGLTRKELDSDTQENSVIFNALIRHERTAGAQAMKRMGIDPATATLEQLEEARNRTTYKQILTGTLPVIKD